jgi:Flp pilus assembly protein TadB
VEIVNAVIAALGIGVTVLVAWASTRTTRARRRAEEAQLALTLLEANRSNDNRTDHDRLMEARLANAARFATTEFTRLMLDDGPRWWSIVPVAVYGVLVLVVASVTPSPGAAAVFVVIGIGCFAYSVVALWLKNRRARRLKEAGIHVPSIRELLEGERRDWSNIWAARRARRVVPRGPEDGASS